MPHPLSAAICLALAGALLVAAPPPARAAALAAPAAKSATAAAVTTQLPREIRPSHYRIAVTPHAQRLAFDGRVEIDIEVLAPTARVVLNALELEFHEARLTPAGGAAIAASSTQVDAKAQTASFGFGRELAPGRYTLALDYSGKIQTQANGLFAIDYENAAGKQRALYTQFENSDARRFVPSWDEPSHKAVFDLQATVPAAQLAVSNLPVAERTELGNGLVRVRFGTSPKMSTYLLFFALGDFERATATADGTEVGVVTQRGALPQAAFALEASTRVLHEFNDYFGVPYPLPKLDNVASPGSSQFFAAMENWGAIFSFEYALLVNPEISTQADRQRIFEIAAHEIAHQWFGNLVTMSWWDDLWLNEGFASWMEYRTTAKLHPEWNTRLSLVGSRDRAMKRDAIASTHPVVQHVETVEQANQAFDAITYSKGQAVITMLEGYVGEDAWREGVRNYMRKHAYGNTVTDDLFREVEAAAGGRPVLEIAHQFTLQPGIPLIRVESATCKPNFRTEVVLSQGEFTADRPDKAPLHWKVPVLAAVSKSPPGTRGMPSYDRVFAVVDGRTTMDLSGCGPVVVNHGQSGYYRTLYAPAAFAALRDNFAQLEPMDQLGVLADTWALGLAGLQPASDTLDLALATPLGADTQVWARIAGAFESIDDYYRDDALRQARFRAFALPRLAPLMARVGWEPQAGEKPNVAILRAELIGILGALEEPGVIAEARRRYRAAASDPAAMPAALRKTILGIVAANADAATWDALRAAARVEKSAQVKDQYYTLLASARDPALAQRALAMAISDEPGATNSAKMIYVVAGRYPELAFDFALANMAAVDQRVDATSRSVYYPGLAAASGEVEMIAKVQAYAEQYLDKGSRRAADTAVANIRNRIKVRQEQLPVMDAWLVRNEGAKAAP